MSVAVSLPGLVGTNPLGVLAALGVLDVFDRAAPGLHATLRWCSGLRPHAVVGGLDDVENVIDLLEQDRARWLESPVLEWGGDGAPLDLKVTQRDLAQWAVAVRDQGDRADMDLFCSLLAEGAVAGKGDSKPTHLHFTAGQQKFLAMVREIVRAVGPQHLREALVGPWEYRSNLPTLGWDSRGERSYAMRATDPSKEQRPGIPGADWLGFLGLTFFPVANHGGSLVTRGCARPWKRSSLRWPLWDVPLTRRTVASLIGDPDLTAQGPDLRRARGITQVLQAPIRRTDQGGYGSFGPATLVLPPVAGLFGPDAAG